MKKLLLIFLMSIHFISSAYAGLNLESMECFSRNFGDMSGVPSSFYIHFDGENLKYNTGGCRQSNSCNQIASHSLNQNNEDVFKLYSQGVVKRSVVLKKSLEADNYEALVCYSDSSTCESVRVDEHDCIVTLKQ